MRIALWSICIMLCQAACADDRVGLSEPFDTAEGWVAGQAPGSPDERYAPKAMKIEDGSLVVQTQVGVLSGFPDSVFTARKITPRPGISRISKKYGEVDLDKYHYLVAQMPSAQGCTSLRINNKETKVLYTTGLHAQDLCDIPELKGSRDVTFELIFFNGAGRVVMDDIRLVSKLTPEEEKALISRGFEVREQKLKAAPYQGLEALYDRGRAPFCELLKSEAEAGGPGLAEGAVFRDQATHAPIMKLTRYPGSDCGQQFSANGRWILLKNSLRPGYNEHVVDLRTHKILTLPPGQHEFYPKDGNKTALVTYERKGGRARLTAQECDVCTMKVRTIVDKEVVELPVGNVEFSFSQESNKFVYGIREYETCFLVDPEAKEAERLRVIKLPYPIKGMRLAHKDRFITFANCYTYQLVFYDYQEDKTYVRCQRFAGGHNALGGGVIFGPYGAVLKLVAPDFDMSETPGDTVRLHSNYHNCKIDVDYGAVSPDGRWAFQDGVRGDVDKQIVAFDLNEGGNVIPVFFHNASSVGWDVKPYVRVSPDSTKVALYSCDMLGDGDPLLVPFQRPDPPRDITVEKVERGLVVSWQPAERFAETWGYNVYHSTSRAEPFKRLNDTPITDMKYTDIGADLKSVYLVTAVENSGLESRLPAPAWLKTLTIEQFSKPPAFPTHAAIPAPPRDDAATVFLEAECADVIALPFRRQYDGYAANFSVMRLMPESPEETEGKLTFNIPASRLHANGERRYNIGLRCRLRSEIYPETKEASLKISVDGKLLGGVQPSGKHGLEWRFMQAAVVLESGDHELVIKSSSPGTEVDRLALCDAEAERPWAKDSENPEPELRMKLTERSTGVTAKADGPFAMKLSWIGANKDVAYYSLYASEKPKFDLTNETLVGSTDSTRFRDAGLRPGTNLYYRVAGYDTRGRVVALLGGQGKTLALPKPFILTLSAKSARLGSALELVKEDGRDFVRAKSDVKATGPDTSIHFSFDLPKTGDYTIWFYNRPQGDNRYMNFQLDQTAAGIWTERFMLPGQRVEMKMLKGGKSLRWYVNRLLLRLPIPQNAKGERDGPRPECQDVLHLKAGSHDLNIALVQDKRSAPPDIGDIILTDDLTWYPEDYDPRAQFRLEESKP